MSTSSNRAEIAKNLISAAANGVRDPIQLESAAAINVIGNYGGVVGVESNALFAHHRCKSPATKPACHLERAPLYLSVSGQEKSQINVVIWSMIGRFALPTAAFFMPQRLVI